MAFRILLASFFLLHINCYCQQEVKLRKRDRRKDIEMVTSVGTIILRLYDSTPLHRDNFLRLVKSHYYDSTLFHRVIKNFMVQGGDPESKLAIPGQPLGRGGPDYTVPSEFRISLFHKKGTLAAARMGDDVNPEKASSASQFYIVQGKQFTDEGLDSIEIMQFHGRKIPSDQRDIYKSIGGTPFLDQKYTVFGEVIKGIDVVDIIASEPTSSGPDEDRPLKDIRILKMKLIRRKHHLRN